jgi:hypothetical protein
MQHTQQNYQNWLWALALACALFLALATAFPVAAADATKPDPILSGTADGPCDPALAQPDFVPGTDVEGHQVASADLENGPIKVPGEILVPLKSGGAVFVDGKKLDPLLDPKPACH